MSKLDDSFENFSVIKFIIERTCAVSSVHFLAEFSIFCVFEKLEEHLESAD